MKRRVVVTGVGLVTAIGNDVPTTWNSLVSGGNGADYIKRFDTDAFPVKFACEVKGFDALDFLDKKEARRMGAFTHYAIAASDEAVKDSGLVIDESNAEMVGTYISSGIGDFWAIEREHEKLLTSGQGFAVLYRFGDRQSGGRKCFDKARSQRPEFGDRDGVFGRCACDRRQLSHNRTRRRRRDDLRRCRRRDHADVGCGLCVDACTFDA